MQIKGEPQQKKQQIPKEDVSSNGSSENQPAATGPAPSKPSITMGKSRSSSLLDEAPSSMTEQSPSTFKAEKAGIKKKFRFGKLLLGCFAVCLVMFFAIGGVGVYAYCTDADIPIISDIVEKIKGMFADPQDDASQMVEELSSSLVGMLMPLARGNEDIMANFVTSSISEDYINQFLTESEDTQSVRFEVDMSMWAQDGNNEKKRISDGVEEISITGAWDMFQKDEPESEMSISADVATDGVLMAFGGESKTLGDVMYFKVSEYPQMFAMYMDSFKDEWIKIDSDSTEGIMGEFGNMEQEDTQPDMTEDDIDKLMQFVSDDVIVKNAELLPDETIKGVDCNCVRISFNQDAMRDALRKWGEIYDEDISEDELDEVVEDLKFVSFGGCIGKKTHQVHKIYLKIEGTSEKGDSNVIEISIKLWDYNVGMDITAPSSSTDVEDLLNDMMPTYDGPELILPDDYPEEGVIDEDYWEDMQ